MVRRSCAPARDLVFDRWSHWNSQADAGIGDPRIHIDGLLKPYLESVWSAGSPPEGSQRSLAGA
eukprot:7897418-Lingulodinium_polyedra.AAC.1